MDQKIGLVWNPSKVSEEDLRGAIDTALTNVGSTGGDPDGDAAQGTPAAPEVQWFETTPEDPGQGAAAKALAAGCNIVVAAGGDGTVRAVAEGIGGTGSPEAELGIIPLGTGNLLARNLGVPLGNITAAFSRVLTGTASPLDLGEVRISFANGSVEQHGFVVMIGFGIDAHMIVETDDELKAKAGWLAYVESLGRAATATEVVEFSLSLDDERPAPEHAHTLLIANCGMIQGGMTLVPDAQPDDGQLDLLVLRADGAAAWLDTMRNMVWDNGLKRILTRADRAESSDSTQHLRATTVRAQLPHPHAFEVDGDNFEDVTGFEVRILPSALAVR